jgi:hypothetical protein
MKKSHAIAALAGVLLLVCAAIAAWAWHWRATGQPPAMQRVTAGPASPIASVKPSSSPTPRPVTYVLKATAVPGPPQRSPATPTQGSATPAPAPYAANAGVQTAVPVVQATLAPHVVAVAPLSEPAEAPPQILSMSLSTPVARGGDVVSGTVETSSNVASVEARIAGYSSPMQKVGVGKFALSYRVPKLPFFLHKTYMIQVIARNTRGQAVSTAVPITIR